MLSEEQREQFKDLMIPVSDDGKPIGVISVVDLLDVFQRHMFQPVFPSLLEWAKDLPDFGFEEESALMFFMDYKYEPGVTGSLCQD